MKKTKHIITFLLLVFYFQACDDMLDKEPVSELVYGNFWESEEAASSAIIGLHSVFRDYAQTLWLLGEIRSDIWDGKTLEGPRHIDLVWQDISTDKVPFANWANFYFFIHICNDAISNLPTINFSNNDKKNYLLGQVYGLRAYIYFTMLKTWGAIPLVIEPTVEIKFDEIYLSRTEQKEVMAQIKNDIRLSIEHFNNDYSFQANNRTLWTLPATLMLKGEAYIWSGRQMQGGMLDFEEAKNALQTIINKTNQFKLLDKYSDIFDYNNKNNQEIIFALSYELEQQQNFYSLFTARQTDIAKLYDSQGKLIGNKLPMGFYDYGNRYGVSDKVLDLLFSNPNDQRGEATFIRLYSEPEKTNYVGSVLQKFLGVINSGAFTSVDDIPIFRLAEAYLLLAEAKVYLGEDPSYEINRIRQRALGDNYNEADDGFQNQSEVENINAILEEGLREFIAEGKRWWALRRAGDNYVIENNNYLDYGDEYLFLLPITREMIGVNPSLVQTPGYQ